VQALADAHDTPNRLLSDPPVGLAVCSIDHLVPFQRSATVTWRWRPFPELAPTAVQALADTHDTLSKTLWLPALAVCWIDHSVPFQRSARAPLE
jgi:hypothetical protein